MTVICAEEEVAGFPAMATWTETGFVEGIAPGAM